MANLHEIKNRIESVKSTRKITRAMYLISVSKSKKAKMQMLATRPYFDQVNRTLAEILLSSEHIDSPFIDQNMVRGGKKALYLVLAGDKGMAGGYNHNIIDLLDRCTDKENAEFLVAGTMGRTQVARNGYHVKTDFIYAVMNPTVNRSREIAEICAERFLSQEYYEINLVYTKMITPIKYEPVLVRLLPFAPDEFSDYTPTKSGQMFEYEPNPVAVFNHLAPHYLKGVIYSAFVEAFTSEQHARTYAMDNATKSAEDMIDRLSLIHNRARQAKITQEINEIIGGIPAE